MKAFRLKHTRTRVHQTQRYPLYACLAVVLALVVALGIVWAGKNRAEAAYQQGREQLAEAIQTDLNAARRSFDKSSMPGTDVQGEVLPEMKEYLYAAKQMNRAMRDIYGEAVLDDETFQQLQVAISGVNQKITGGQSTKQAIEVLASCMNEVETDLNTRFADSGMLLSRTALK
ncbi:MAG: hypothetical protein RSJ41_06055 [Clostridia bacterium]